MLDAMIIFLNKYWPY